MVRPTQIFVELGPMKVQWSAWCARHGLSVSEGVRRLVHAELGDEPELPDIDVPRNGKCFRRVQVALTREEFEGVVHRARVGGFAPHRWIIALVRANLSRKPQPGEGELRLLAESNQQLAVIRMRLGALVRSGATANAQCELEELREMIGEHLQTVSRILRASLDRWSR